MRILLLVGLLSACATSTEPELMVMRVGQLRPSLPQDCKAQLVDAPAFAAMLLLTQVGMITAQVEQGHIDDKLRQAVRAKACGLGGDVITFNVGFSNGGKDVVQFLVFKKPEEQKPAAPQQSGGTSL